MSASDHLSQSQFNRHDLDTTAHGFIDTDEPEELGSYEYSHTVPRFDVHQPLHSHQGTMHSPVMEIYRNSRNPYLGEATVYDTDEHGLHVVDGHHKIAAAREGVGYVSARIYR